MDDGWGGKGKELRRHGEESPVPIHAPQRSPTPRVPAPNLVHGSRASLGGVKPGAGEGSPQLHRAYEDDDEGMILWF